MSYIERSWIKIQDAEACLIVYQVLRALEHLHRQGICHRDLKPENILMSTPAPGARVILADFGHSTKLSGGKQAHSRRMKTASVGTDHYVAPCVCILRSMSSLRANQILARFGGKERILKDTQWLRTCGLWA